MTSPVVHAAFICLALNVSRGVSALAAQTEATTFQATVDGMTCAQGGVTVIQLDCVYKVGKSLEIVIAGVGLPETGITVVRSDGYDNDYFATFGVMHGCMIVKPGRLTMEDPKRTGRPPDFAFISPATGNVYRTWHECAATTQVSKR